ncbi:hypothetical protein Bbelb_153250 [Branchiostoma belcheri]|nr:hypothetical protein Bbelb_153250 [Branchiostoma belcheri]
MTSHPVLRLPVDFTTGGKTEGNQDRQEGAVRWKRDAIAVDVGCASQPCLWGATCFKSGENSYYCHCRRDFSGKNCGTIDVSSRCSRFPRNMRRECWMRGGALPDPIAGFVN